jgi:hypothetical protein
MIAKIRLDQLGRIVLSKRIGDKLQLSTCAELEFESSDDRIVLGPLRGTGQLRKEQGVWVFIGSEPLTAETLG